jgi:hypothetical protein
VLCLAKSRDDREGPISGFELEELELGIDEDNEPFTSCVIRAQLGQAFNILAGKRGHEGGVARKPVGLLLFLNCARKAIDKHGEEIPTGEDGTSIPVKAVSESHFKEVYFAHIAERAEPNENAEKLRDKQRNGFKSNVKKALDQTLIFAREHNGERYIWLPPIDWNKV